MHSNQVTISPLNFWKSILWVAIIAIGLFTPGDKFPERKIFEFNGLDKILHLLIFGFLQFLILLEMHISKIIFTRKRILISLVISISYGMLTEIVQYIFISKRKGSLLDLFADITGIMLALGFFFLVQKLIDRLFPLKI